MATTAQLEEFVRIFQLPPAMVPYVDLVVTEEERALVVALGDQALTRDEVAEMLSISLVETDALLKRVFQRDIVDRQVTPKGTTYSAGTFYLNMDYWTSFETASWRRLPRETRAVVSEWQMEEWLKRWRTELELITRDPDAWVRMKNRDVLLLEEALELVEAAECICLLPCPCKTTMMPGSPVIEGSMRVGERARITLEREQGRALTVEEAKAHLVALDRMGLIHTGPRAWRQHDPQQEWISHGNCHPAYSFPFRAGMRVGMAKRYPRVHYVARVDWDQCTHCGVCTRRCLFGAFYHDGATVSIHGERLRQIQFDAARCWGCGLCANTCPENAIAMDPL